MDVAGYSHDFQRGELVEDTGREAGEDVPRHVAARQERKRAWRGPGPRGHLCNPGSSPCPEAPGVTCCSSRALGCAPDTRRGPRGWPGAPGCHLQPEEAGEPLEDAGAQAADAVVGEVPARQEEGTSARGTPRSPQPPRAALAGTYRRLSSGRPRKAPGCTVLIRLFFRSLRGDGHRLRVLGALRHHPAPPRAVLWGVSASRSPSALAKPLLFLLPPWPRARHGPSSVSSLQEPRPGGKRRWIRIAGELPPGERGHAAATTPRPRCCCSHHPPGAERGSSGGRSEAPRAPQPRGSSFGSLA